MVHVQCAAANHVSLVVVMKLLSQSSISFRNKTNYSTSMSVGFHLELGQEFVPFVFDSLNLLFDCVRARS